MKTYKLSFYFLKFLILSAFILVIGCASRPPLENYSRSEIERPYTLPKGVTNWHIPLMFENSSNRSSEAKLSPIVLPLLWETSLSDDWNLIFMPLPLGVTHQFFKTNSDRLGFALFTGFSYDSLDGYRLKPSLSLGYRRKLNDFFAVDFIPTYTPTFAFDKKRDHYWSASFRTAPLFQLTEVFAVSPDATLYWLRDRTEIELSNSGVSWENSDRTLFGVGGSVVWSISRQWDFRTSFHYAWGQEFRSNFGEVDLVHFW